jgi:hypothetical protein
MRTQPSASRPQPGVRPLQAIDQKQAAVLAAMRRQAARERRALGAPTTNVNGRSEK